ncbi:MAG: hypothetical protein IT290_12615 [Deltaproteobacteria bacterium]|nr:hypothetical protein [Deltaproteobacteria bacterium]
MNIRAALPLLFLLPLLFAGCDSRTSQQRAAAPAQTLPPVSSSSPLAEPGTSDFIPASLRNIFDSSGKVIGEAGSVSQEELKKLGQFEYRVVTLADGLSEEVLERDLNTLGKEGWECFSTQEVERNGGPALRFFCKKRPFTPLRFVPQTLLGR